MAAFDHSSPITDLLLAPLICRPILRTQPVYPGKFSQVSGYNDKSSAPGVSDNHQIVRPDDTTTSFQVRPDFCCMRSGIIIKR